MNVREYLESLSPELGDKVKIIMINEHLGVHTNGNPKKTCSGCTPTTPNGACYEIDEVCTWVPFIG